MLYAARRAGRQLYLAGPEGHFLGFGRSLEGLGLSAQAEVQLEWPSRLALRTARELRACGMADAVGGALAERRELRRWLHENGLGDLDAEIGGDAHLGRLHLFEGRGSLEEVEAAAAPRAAQRPPSEHRTTRSDLVTAVGLQLEHLCLDPAEERRLGPAAQGALRHAREQWARGLPPSLPAVRASLRLGGLVRAS